MVDRLKASNSHIRSQSMDIATLHKDKKDSKKKPPLSVLKNTSFAASFSDRDNFIVPQVSPKPKLTEKSVEESINGVIELAKSGVWRAALRLTDQLSIKLKPTAPPHILLQLSELRIVICFKLRLFKSISDEFSKLGDFNDISYQYESYPSLYPSMKGSFVPFTLRLLQAELPSYQGNLSLTIDSLYQLKNICKDEIQNLYKNSSSEEDSKSFLDINDIDKIYNGPIPLPNYLNPIEKKWNPEKSIFQADINKWRERYLWISLQIISHFIQQKDYISAFPEIDILIEKYPNDPMLLSAIGRIYLQIGIIKQADIIFKLVENINPLKDDELKYNELIEMNKGCLQVGYKNFKDAQTHFSNVIALNPQNISATNNMAVCLVYLCQLTRAIHLLEDFIAQDPSYYLCEVIVQNLTCLYELHSNSGGEKKANLMKLVAQYASDSFDHSQLKRNT